MIEQQIYSKLFLLQSLQLKQELAFFLDYLLAKQFGEKEQSTKKVPVFGCAKGKFKLSEDFNAPIDHFDSYMPA